MSEPVNIVRLREATLDDDEFLVELVEMFLTDASDQLDLLASAIDSRDQVDVARKAHRLRGACSNVGAEELARLCAELESKSDSGARVAMSSVGAVQDEFARVNSALQGCVREAKSRVS